MMDAVVSNIKTSSKRSGRSSNVSIFCHQFGLFKANANCTIFSLEYKVLIAKFKK